MKRTFLALLLAPLCILSGAEPRNALVMGVWQYADPTFPALPGIETDVTKIAEKLKTLGFNVTVVTNPTLKRAKRAVDDFGTTLKAAKGTGLFYFSGHGSEFEGKNYLVPTGTAIASNRDLDEESLAANRILDRMEESGGEVNIVFLDCCRNSLSKSGGSGLASMEARGTFIGFATASAKVAGAGTEGSAYTAALLEKLGTPGVSINDMHTMVTKRVMELTENSQVPFQYSGLNVAFALVPSKPSPVAPVPSMTDAEIQRRIEEEVKKRMASVAVPTPTPTPTPASVPPQRAPSVTPSANPPSSPSPASGLASATRERPFVNSLGMKFVPVPGTKVLFCQHETRVSDFAAFVAGDSGYDYAKGGIPFTWQGNERKQLSGRSWAQPGFTQSGEHPVICVNWDDAKAFCEWLSQKEGKKYRLPTDYEWSVAVGIGHLENALASPSEKDKKIAGVYPWGGDFPIRGKVGNYDSEDLKYGKSSSAWVIKGYRDGFAQTAPVGSFAPNALGIHDLGGNVREFCEDWYSEKKVSHVLRGGSWSDGLVGGSPEQLLSSYRFDALPTRRDVEEGFRCVLALSNE
ncbi:hypothetical protein AYO49_00555 [Verrucomicrobiaceae bacterium SCGC AG-212-N21]|nr:hypothetical protein AYO49_00555 [Verrucomicrobiaceae bacterium SCGC AG-212-N21]